MFRNMSNMRLPPPIEEDFPDASAKHLDDAHVLFDHGRIDGAAYLSGYVLECCFKTLVIFQMSGGKPPASVLPHQLKKHGLSALSQEVQQLALVTGPGNHVAPYVSGLGSTRSIDAGWKVTLRYNSPGAVSEKDCLDWIIEAETVYQQTVGKMRIQGVVI
jgi:hypothetical protein